MLYLVPVPIHPESKGSLPIINMEIVNSVNIIITESIREARRNLRRAGSTLNFDSVTFHELDKHQPENNRISDWLEPLQHGEIAALISDAGCPAVADPGAEVVSVAHRMKIKVVPLTGPSSIILSLMASGLNGQSFAFQGYLPIKQNDRINKIRVLENESQQKAQTQIFIETPYRNNQVLQDLLTSLQPDTRLCIATNLTGPNEKIVTLSIQEWKQRQLQLDKVPAVFLFLRS